MIPFAQSRFHRTAVSSNKKPLFARLNPSARDDYSSRAPCDDRLLAHSDSLYLDTKDSAAVDNPGIGRCQPVTARAINSVTLLSCDRLVSASKVAAGARSRTVGLLSLSNLRSSAEDYTTTRLGTRYHPSIA